MAETKITEISIRENPPRVDGWHIVATFTCQARGIELRGCSLVVNGEGHIVAWPPRAEHQGTRLHAVRFCDRDLRNDVADAALSAFRALGGAVPEGLNP